jgi:hypothetical protein
MDVIDKLHAAEDEYAEAYNKNDGNLEKYLDKINEFRKKLYYSDLASVIARYIADQMNQPGTLSTPRELWAYTYNFTNDDKTNIIDDDRQVWNDECSICLEPFTEKSLICSPNVCHHAFHCRCIKKTYNKNCPFCALPYTRLVLSTFRKALVVEPKDTSFGFKRKRIALNSHKKINSDIHYLRGL